MKISQRVKNQDKLLGIFQKIARVLTGNYNVKVVPSKISATDGETIYFPSLSLDFPDAPIQVLHGWLDHEICHVIAERENIKRSQFSAIEIIQLGIASSDKEEFFLNVFEDIRVENMRFAHMPGVAENLRAKRQYCIESWRALFDYYDDYDDFDSASVGFWNILGFAIILQAQDEDTSWVPSACISYLDVIKDEIEASKVTSCAEDCFDLCRRAVRKFDFLSERPFAGQEEAL